MKKSSLQLLVSLTIIAFFTWVFMFSSSKPRILVLQSLSESADWAIRIEQEANRKFLLAAEVDHYFESNFEAMLRGDTIARFKAYSIARNWSILSPNEIRKMENYPPVPGGDVLLSPVNMAPLNSGGLQAAGANAPAGDMADGMDQADAFGDKPPAAGDA